MNDLDRPIELLKIEDLPCAFGRFELVGILGAGGMGRVFRAQMVGPAGFRKQVALKVLQEATGEEAQRGRMDLVNEARLGALLHHPNVIDTYDLGEIDGRLFVAMELVDGPSLRDVIKGKCTIPATAVLEMGVKICAGLGHAHNLVVAGRSVEFVHRDVKPGNILLGQYGEIKITDFGISRAREVVEQQTQAGTLRGSPAYMSPEQFNGLDLDRRSDIFSLGVMLFEMLTKTRVFKAKNLAHLATQILDVDYLVEKKGVLSPAASRLPGIETVLGRCLRCNPDERYPSCEELAEDLRALAQGISLNRYVAGLVRAHLDETYEGITEEVRREVTTLAESEVSQTQGTPETTTRAPTSSTPIETDSFVGRVFELSRLEEQLTGSQHLVTLRGMAGVGKTRLGLRYASARSSEDGQVSGLTYVCCASFDSQRAFIDGVFLALEQSCPEALSPEQQLVTLGRMFAAMGDHLLIVDRFDQLVENAESCLPQLLEGAPQLRILATSRERLWLDAEYILDLEPLPLTEGVWLLQERIGRDALEDTSSDLLARVVQLLDGNPLAIELAAAQVVEHGLHDVEGQLREWVDRSRVETDSETEGGSILDEALEWSWSRLEPWERDALAQCSVFQGGFFLDAAAAVLDLSAHGEAPWLMDVVVSLNNKSLLRRDEVDGSVRFGLFESIRAFAAGKLEEDESTRIGLQMGTAAGRHARHYGSFGVDAVVDGLAFVGGQSLGRRLRADTRNLWAALSNALEAGAADDAAGAFVCLVCSMGEAGLTPESLDPSVDRLLSMRDMTPGWRARSLRAAGILWRRSKRSADAVEALEEAVEISRTVGDRVLEATCLQSQGAALWIRHEIDQAARCFKESMTVSREVGFEAGVCRVLGNFGNIAKARGQLDKGEEYLREVLRMADELGMEHEQYMAENNLGLLYLDQGHLEPAEKYLLSSLEGARKWGNLKAETITLLNLGLLGLKRDDYSTARRFYDSALAQFISQGDRWGEGICLSNVGILLLREEKFSGAENALRRGIACHEEISNDQGIAHMKALLAQALLTQERLDEAWTEVVDAEAFYERTESSRYYATLLCVRADVCLAKGDIGEARAAFVRSRALAVTHQVDHEAALGKNLRELKERLDAFQPTEN